VRERRDADPGSIRAFGAVLGEYQRLTGDSVLVSWLGGEPLLWPPLADLTRTLRSEHRLRISTTTNGTCLDSAETRRHILENYAELTVSVDAEGSLHDELRGWAGGFTSLERNFKALAEEKRATAQGPILKANVVLMRQTLVGFADLCLRLAGWGVEEVTFNQLGGNDRPEFYPEHRLLPDQADWLAAELPRLQPRLALRGLRLHGTGGYARRIQATAQSVRLPVDECLPGQTFLFIDEAGQIAPCSFTAAGYGVPLADIRSVAELRQLPLRFSAARQRRRLAACEDCHSTQFFEKFAA
jgi:MoaA/NifB/PqqE/SkfB family radical SAM enzyme